MRKLVDDGDSASCTKTGSMRLATWNIHKCIGMDGKFNPRRTARIILDIKADVIALQEADERFGERRGLLGREWLAQNGLTIVGAQGTTSSSHGWCGNVLAVGEQMDVERVSSIKLPGIEPRGAVMADMTHKPSGTRVRVIACHLGLLRRCRVQQAKTLAAHLRLGMHPGGANTVNPAPSSTSTVAGAVERLVFVMGDTNEWRNDHDQHSSLKHLRSLGLRGERLPTFPSRYPLLMLDRIMSNVPGMVHAYGSEHLASDHLPLIMEARIPATQVSSAFA